MPIEWLYLLTTNDRFPDPVEEIGALHQLLEEGGEVAHLILADRVRPPMCAAAEGERILLCTRPHGHRLRAHGVAHVHAAPHAQRRTPDLVVGIYGERPGRTFVPIARIDLEPARDERELSEDEQRTFARGQAFVKRLAPGRRRAATRPARHAPSPAPREAPPSFAPRPVPVRRPLAAPTLVLGLDPTAGTWETRMRAGPKPMPSIALVLGPDGRARPAQDPLTWHDTNEAYAAAVRARGAAVHCIDGPCDTNGLPLRPDRTGWGDLSRGGRRAAERELARMGIGLFWTTRATLEHFDGASRWIARSLCLFRDAADLPGVPVIETHPHGVFTVLWRALGRTDALRKKGTALGRAQRLALLRAYVPDLEDEHVPDHDAVDAAAAALAAAFHAAGSTSRHGEPQAGGLIWLPQP